MFQALKLLQCKLEHEINYHEKIKAELKRYQEAHDRVLTDVKKSEQEMQMLKEEISILEKISQDNHKREQELGW